MQGISVLNDPNGKPAVLTIDLRNLDPAVSPLVAGLLAQVENNQDDSDRAELLSASALMANRAYGADEPDYDDTDLKELNPNYRPR